METNSPAWTITLVIATTLAICVISLFSINNALEESSKHQIIKVLSLARQQAHHYVQMGNDGTLTREQAEHKVVEVLSLLNNGQDYVWSNDNQGIGRVHIRPEVVGKFQKSYTRHLSKLSDQAFIFETETNIKPGIDKRVVKINGVTLLPDWNWVIGYGVYMDDLRPAFMKVAVNVMIAGLFIIIALGLPVYLKRRYRKQRFSD